jgi:hypothetical protein
MGQALPWSLEEKSDHSFNTELCVKYCRSDLRGMYALHVLLVHWSNQFLQVCISISQGVWSYSYGKVDHNGRNTTNTRLAPSSGESYGTTDQVGSMGADILQGALRNEQEVSEPIGPQELGPVEHDR